MTANPTAYLNMLIVDYGIAVSIAAQDGTDAAWARRDDLKTQIDEELQRLLPGKPVDRSGSVDQAFADAQDEALIAEWRRLNLVVDCDEPATVAEVAKLRKLAAVAIRWRAQFYKPAKTPRVQEMFDAVDALIDDKETS